MGVDLQRCGIIAIFARYTQVIIHVKFSTLIFMAAGALCAASCSRAETDDSRPRPEVLMQVGDSVLTRDRVVAQLPAGISKADSARLFDAIVEEWLERNMLVDVAVKNLPDMDRIDRLVEQYRRQLLADEYRRLMAAEHAGTVPPDSVRAHYDRNADAYRLSSPVLKGIYVKLPSGAPQLSEVRAWMKSATPEAIDELEAYGLKGAMEYDYFGDEWVAWEEIARHIPYRFPSPEAMLVPGKMFETSAEGITYILHVIDAIPAGERMPFDFARPVIEQELAESARDSYDRRLLREIYARELDSRRIHAGTYVPLRYRDLK